MKITNSPKSSDSGIDTASATGRLTTSSSMNSGDEDHMLSMTPTGTLSTATSHSGCSDSAEFNIERRLNESKLNDKSV